METVDNGSRTLCQARRKDGQPCRAQAIHGDLCFAHSPEFAAKRREARQRGGQNSAIKIRRQKLAPESLSFIDKVLIDTLNGLLSGEIEPPRAQAVSSLINIALKVSARGGIDARLKELEDHFPLSGEPQGH